MSDPASRLPARPSLEQLRKQAKERLAALRKGDPRARLADAQHGLAQEYGFESWPKLAHHVESVRSSGNVERFEHLAEDFLAGYRGESEALQRLIAYLGVSYNRDQVRRRVRSRVTKARGEASGEPTLADVRRMVAHDYGFDGWAELEEGLAQSPDDTRGSRLGRSTAPPFYRIDAASNTIEPRAPLSESDWNTIFDVMRERGITRITTPAMTDGAMARLARLDFVTSVDVGGARGLTDEGLLHLADMPQLEELDLSGGYSPITDRGLDVLRHLKRLRRYTMSWAQHVSDAGVANLTFCDHLERVDLMGTPTGDGALEALAGKRKLRELSTGTLVTDAGLMRLHDLPAFKTWQGPEVEYDLMTFAHTRNHILLDGPFTDRGLASLEGLDGLLGLNLFWHAKAFTSAGLATLANLSNLEFLGCQGERCDDAAMRSIGTLPKLRMLMAQGTVASDEGFQALSRSETLEYLWGRECPNLHGRGFEALAEMPTLRGLGVSCKNVDDASLAALPRFPSLRELMPMDVPDAGFRHVGACNKLQHLWCMYCRDTGDQATEHIAGLSLKSYYAGETRITDRSLGVLGSIKSLEKLEFWNIAGITDVGLAQLAELPSLREVSISGTPGVSPKGIALFPSRVRVDLGS